ncbi:hypothetical protein [Devosia sp. DBB001]|nr:hypothetical protein [Devosia sp. DBB001]
MDIANHFQRFYARGFTRLVPIIPPGVEISPNSTLYKRVDTKQDGRGKTPGRRNQDGTWGSFDWNLYECDETDLDRWQAMGAGVGIKTGDMGDGTSLVAIDADTKDHAAQVLQGVQDLLGPLPVRVGNYPKALYLCRVRGAFQYQRIEFGQRDENNRLLDRVEVLSDGRQFVAHGIHPKTGKPYEWPRDVPAYADLPVFEAAQITALLEELRLKLPQASEVKVEGAIGQASQAGLRGELEAVRRAVRATPNTHNTHPSRESYRDMGYAIKAALPDNEAEALELFQEWCEGWTAPDGSGNDPDVVEADWRRMKPPYRRGASWLYAQAEELSGGTYSRADAWFENLPGSGNSFFDVATREAEPTSATVRQRPNNPQDPFGFGPTEHLLDLPVDTFPKVIDVWARDTGDRMGVPAVYSAVCALATVAAAIGNKLWIQPKANDTSWREPAILWVMLAEGVGGMKTPSMDAATKPLREVDHESAKEGARRYAEWELLKKTAKGKEAILALPPEPKIKRNVVVDITVEALGAVLGDNRSGVLIHQDELAALLGSLDAYKSSKGGDRAKMLKLFNGGSESVDRVGRKHIPIDFWGASIIGGIQPRKLREISDTLDSDGLLQRFLPIYGDGSAQSKEEVDREPDAIAERAYFSIVKKWARSSNPAEVKAVVKLSPEAQEVWKPVRSRIRDLSFLPGLSEAWKGHLAKGPGLSSRLLLLCHVLDNHEAEPHEVDGIPVSAKTARRAARLVDYLLANSLRFYAECVGAGETVYDARSIAGFILTKPDLSKITRRNIGDANKSLRTEHDRIKRAMQLLTYMDWVVPNTDTRIDPRHGPTQWTICPEVHDGRFASYAANEMKQRREAQIKILAAGAERTRIMGAGSVFD